MFFIDVIWLVSAVGKLTMLAVRKIIMEQTREHVCMCTINNLFSRKNFKCKIYITLCSGCTCSSQISRVDWVATWVEDIFQVVLSPFCLSGKFVYPCPTDETRAAALLQRPFSGEK